jgi:hypothetical protein
MPQYNRAITYINPDPCTIKDFLIKNVEFKIPAYQRNYAWEQDQLEKLWEDITDTEKNNFTGFDLKEETVQRPHFLGAIVTEQGSGLVIDEEIIDGQQRIITLIILLYTLRDFVQLVSNVTKRNTLQGFIDRLVRGNNAAAGEISCKVELNREHDFFLKTIVRPPSFEDRKSAFDDYPDPNSLQKRFKEAVGFFQAQLHTHLGPSESIDFADKLERLINTVSNLLMILHLGVTKPGLAVVIFETLNARGMDLKQADLIKNEINKQVHQISENESIQAMKRWDEMLALLPDDTATEYIRHFHASRIKDVKAKDLFETVSDYLSPQKTSSYMLDLKEEASNYRMISEASTSNQKTNSYLADINDPIKVTMSYILLLAGAKKFGVNSSEFEQLARITRDFSLRYLTIGREGTPAKIEQIMGNAARVLRAQNGTINQVVEIFQNKSSDNVFKEDFSIYSAKQGAIGFYVLRQLEIYLDNEAGKTVPYTRSYRQHLEHIMPQTPDSNLGWGHIMDGDKKSEVYPLYLNRLGNLLVLDADINVEIKNKSFADKQSGYLRSQLKLPHRVNGYLNHETKLWDYDSIQTRQKALAELAVKIWNMTI